MKPVANTASVRVWSSQLKALAADRHLPLFNEQSFICISCVDFSMAMIEAIMRRQPRIYTSSGRRVRCKRIYLPASDLY